MRRKKEEKKNVKKEAQRNELDKNVNEKEIKVPHTHFNVPNTLCDSNYEANDGTHTHTPHTGSDRIDGWLQVTVVMMWR